jgi:acyl carrier protein
MNYYVEVNHRAGRPARSASGPSGGTWGELQEILRSVFPDEAASITRETRLHDNGAWDWPSQVTLLLEVERRFRVRYSISEMAYLRTIGQLVELIDSKRR